MKKGKVTWLPLALILAAGSTLLAMGCDNGDDPAKTDPIPEETQVKYNGKNITTITDIFQPTVNPVWQLIQIDYKDEYHGQVDKFSIIYGHDILDKPTINVIALQPMGAPGTTISRADYEALKAKFKAALPDDFKKTFIDHGFADGSDMGGNVSLVSQYAAIIKDAVIRLAQSVKANFARGA
jgi:hypothetical protein